MTTFRSIESTTRKFMWAAVILLAATAAACGGSTQGLAGTAPSQVSAVAAASDSGGNLSLLKEGKGKGGHSGPEVGTIPDPEDAEAHGKAMIQIEGFTESIDGPCDAVTIVMKDGPTVITDEETTEFQRAECQAIEDAAAENPVRLHIAATMQGDVLVAVYVRMQGPKFDDGLPDDAEEEEGTTN